MPDFPPQPNDLLLSEYSRSEPLHGSTLHSAEALATTFPKVIRVVNGRIHTGHMVGVLQNISLRVTIIPKLSKEGDASISNRNLLHLLDYTSPGEKIHLETAAALAERRTDIFEILIFLFASRLLTALRKGVVRKYVEQEEELPYLVGQWQLHLDVAKPVLTAFNVVHDEFVANTHLNRVLRTTVETLRKATHDEGNRTLLRACNDFLVDVVLLARKPNRADFRRIHFNRINAHFKTPIAMADVLMRHLSIELHSGAAQEFGFVINMNRLFESFIRHFLSDHDVLAGTSYASCKIISKHKYLTAGHSFKLIPDIALWRRDAAQGIIDTKYKRLDAEAPYCGVSQNDVYQMFAYSQRYACRNILLLYPACDSAPNVFTNHEFFEGSRLSIATVEIRRDLSDPAQVILLREELRSILQYV